MRLIRVMGTVFLLLALYACATGSPSTKYGSADYGSYPDNYREIIMAYYSRTLIEPSSAQYRWIREPFPGLFSEAGQFKAGYIVQVGINAKNKTGVYAGERQEAVLIKNGVVIDRMPL